MRKNNEIFYSLAEAKAKFSEVVKMVRSSDVLITKNGKPCVVMIDYERYKRMTKLIDDLYDLYLLEVGDPSKFDEVNRDNLLEEDVEEV
ncbi:type II toxin-antitoxin system Phd/YefM family antitoxin [Pseudothermotoga sp. U03pept]|uniref:type II toxin-antitoxin system Phd/YefM family antitoxin n=1 Tax=Pseudothermotoga sp. U03pept TaxID=3447012 RepID=UPI003F053083